MRCNGWLRRCSTDSFVIDTIDPFVVTIVDDQSGIAFDGANTVTYTLTFSEPVQSVTYDDLTVTGVAMLSLSLSTAWRHRQRL